MPGARAKLTHAERLVINRRKRKAEVCEILDKYADEGSISYEDLMARYQWAFFWAYCFAESDKTKKRLLNIQKQALHFSLRRIARKEGILAVGTARLADNHPALYGFAMRNYNGREAVRTAVEEAGIEYPYAPVIRVSLRNALEYIEKQNGERNTILQNVPVMSALDRAGLNFGQAAILTGIDYTKKTPNWRPKYDFANENLIQIIGNRSLNDIWRVRCSFNSLALQYYPWLWQKGKTWRELDGGNAGNFEVCQQESYFEGRIVSFLEQKPKCSDEPEGTGKSAFRVSLTLEGADNPVHRAEFYLQGKNVTGDALRIYHSTDRLLKELDSLQKRA